MQSQKSRATIALVLAALICTVAMPRLCGTTVASAYAMGAGPSVTTYFGPGPIRTAIPTQPVIDPNSQPMVAQLFQHPYANSYLFGITLYNSGANDPVFTVNNLKYGANPFNKVVRASGGSGACNPLHIPADAAAPTGANTDGWMYVIDNTKPGLLCALWVASKKTGKWQMGYGGVFDVNGDGSAPLAGSGTGSNLTQNVILASEIQQGVIPHALAFASPRNSKAFRAPATKTDGGGNGPLQEGMRFQLDPAFNCSTLPAAQKIERMVCVALQTYGAYDVDSTSGQTGFFFQTDDPTDPARKPWAKPGDFSWSGGLYRADGLNADYQVFSDIPLSRMRLLAHWQGN